MSVYGWEYRDRLDFLFVRVSLVIHYRLIHRLKYRILLPLTPVAPSFVVVPVVVVVLLLEMRMSIMKSLVVVVDPVMMVVVVVVEEWWVFGNRLAFTGETKSTHTPMKK